MTKDERDKIQLHVMTLLVSKHIKDLEIRVRNTPKSGYTALKIPIKIPFFSFLKNSVNKAKHIANT